MNASVRRRLAQTLPAPGVAFSECVVADGFSCHAAEQAYCAWQLLMLQFSCHTRPTCGFCVSSCSECDVDGVQYHGVTHQDANDMNASVRRRLAQTLPAPGVRLFGVCGC